MDSTGRQRDHWWDISSGQDLEPLSQEVSGLIFSLGLPFLERFDGFEPILSWRTEFGGWESGVAARRLEEAILRADLGDLEAGKAILFSFRNHRDRGLRARAYGIALRLGIENE